MYMKKFMTLPVIADYIKEELSEDNIQSIPVSLVTAIHNYLDSNNRLTSDDVKEYVHLNHDAILDKIEESEEKVFL